MGKFDIVARCLLLSCGAFAAASEAAEVGRDALEPQTCSTGYGGCEAPGRDAQDMEVSLLQQKQSPSVLHAGGDSQWHTAKQNSTNLDLDSREVNASIRTLGREGWHHGHGRHHPEPVQGDCKEWGCAGGFDSKRICQCSHECRLFDNCCGDYGELCAAKHRAARMSPTTTTTTNPLHTCANFGCSDDYVRDQPCQCGEECLEHNNCCGDYTVKCSIVALSQRRRRSSPRHCIAGERQNCTSGATRLAVHQTCDPLCPEGALALGPWVCSHGDELKFRGPGCVKETELPKVPKSSIDSVPDARNQSDMVFKNFGLINGTRPCLIWPQLQEPVKKFIIVQASKYGPSKAAIEAEKKKSPAEFYLNYEQVSILMAQLLCGATESAVWKGLGPEKVQSHIHGTDVNPQAYAFGRAMEHWHLSKNGKQRDPKWRRTTLVGYGTFGSDSPVPDASSKVRTWANLTVTSGCSHTGPHDVGIGADAGLADSKTLTVIFAGHWVGGFLRGWTHANTHGAQEEKFTTIVPELMLATEPLRRMGAGLLSNGDWDPWRPMAGWYILGAGTFVKGSYPYWTPDAVSIKDPEDYMPVGTGRRMRRRGLVGILGKPCNDRPGCDGNGNTYDMQYRCFNQQVDDGDMTPEPQGGNLWGVAAGAYNFANWPPQARAIMRRERANQRWTLQAGGWGAGAFGCGTLYGGLVQLLAAKKGGWRNMRMCWASREESFPTLRSKLGYAAGSAHDLREDYIKHIPTDHTPLLHGQNLNSFEHGKIVFTDHNYGAVARQLHARIEQHDKPRTCASTRCQHPETGVFSSSSTCLSRMRWCCRNKHCEWHKDKREDIRDFVARTCNERCSGVCIRSEDVPNACRKPEGGAEEDERSCAKYGCGANFSRAHRCQCTVDCKKHDNCCADFDQTCQQGPYSYSLWKELGQAGLSGCATYGCSKKWTANQKCQCAEMCQNFGNCCPDYHARCARAMDDDESGRNTARPEIPGSGNKTSCEYYGCSYVHQKYWRCQCYHSCNTTAGSLDVCCDDKPEACKKDLRPKPDSCATYGCGGRFNPRHKCQCISACKIYKSCCDDYKEVCGATPATPTRTP
eukprot:TRINITY_DN37533_c0_g1_i1.p1 TRINITY_DN37533_c0_g1~~TRINITY_DN37533_c0_g1_i1.p1  ORF type:complete len:1086 (+),score=129.65 TRINITY_DN37533_c0_g1_i1:74-3331(+)